MENIINQVATTFRTYGSQILSDKNIKNLSNEKFSDKVSEESVSVSQESGSGSVMMTNSMKYSTTDDNKLVVQVIRDESGKVVRTIPLNEQHALDIFE